ncbi:MAG: nicotinate-nicotinamide nucleotide adenylyltransferase [Deltaproteobacteria bacterium]|nr:nicotinate-nicotinamide nucleotide adenylyltransferase [Deltaproteobacteria bacterium]
MTDTAVNTGRRVVLLGGSFNPPHLAHQMALLWALSTGRGAQAWLLPCFRHPFGKALIDFEHRLAMCRLLAEPFGERVTVCAIERDLGGESRTLQTIRALIAQYPQYQFALLIGADIVGERAKWYGFGEIERLVDVLVVGRQGVADDQPEPALPAISSSDIRRRIASGEAVDRVLPAPIADYIDQQGLYR